MSGKSSGMTYHDMMGSVGNLRADDQSNYNTRRKGFKMSSVNSPSNQGKSDLNWWNAYPDQPTNVTQNKKSKGNEQPSRPKRVEDSDDTDGKEEVLINLDAPSPLIWTIGMIIVITIIMFGELYQFGLNKLKELFTGDNVFGGPSSELLLLLGAKYAPFITEGEWWRLFSAIFLQNSIVLWALSVFLLIYARSIERDTGFYRMMLTFMVCGTYGYILSCIFVPLAVSAGTTGALIGLVGVMLCDLFASWRMVKHPIVNLIVAVLLIVLLIIVGLFPFVDNFAHIGGLIMGLLTALMLLPNLTFGKCEAYCHGVISFLAFPAMSTLFMICLVVVFRSVDTNISWCKGCDKINCANFGRNWCDTQQT